MASKFNAGGVYITTDIDDKNYKKKANDIQVDLKKKTKQMQSDISSAAANIEKTIGKKLTQTFVNFGKTLAAAFAVKALVNFGKEARKLYKQQEQAEIQLAQMMKNAGTYTKENYTEMKKYASELQAISNYGDEFLMPIIADLSKAKLSTEQLKEATKAAVDLMAGGQSADMLSKVLEKPLEMSQSLRRMGILINQEELKGLTLEQQRSKVLDEINKKYGGLGEAMKDDAKQINNAIGDLKETIGKTLDRTLKRESPKILNLIKTVQDNLQPTLDVLSGIIDGSVIAVKKVTNILSPVILQLQSLFHSLATFVGKSLSDSELAKNWDKYIQHLREGYDIDEMRRLYRDKDTNGVDRLLIKEAINQAIKENNKAIDESAYGKILKFMEKFAANASTNTNGDYTVTWGNQQLTLPKEYLENALTYSDYYNAEYDKKVIEGAIKKIKEGDKDLGKELEGLYKEIQKTKQKVGDILPDDKLKLTNEKLTELLNNLDKDLEESEDTAGKIIQDSGAASSPSNKLADFDISAFIDQLKEEMNKSGDGIEEVNKQLRAELVKIIGDAERTGEYTQESINAAKRSAEKAIDDYIEWLRSNAEYARLNGRIEDVQSSGADVRSSADNLRNANDVSSYLVGRKAYDTAMSKFDEELTKLSDDFAASGEKLTDTQKEEIETKIASINEEKAQTETAFKAAKQTAAFTIAMSLATEAASRAASSIADNLRANGEDERAADVEEGARIFNDSVNNFMDGFSKGGPIMGLIEMIIGWIMELIQRLAPIMQSLETGFASIANVFDGVASLLSPLIALVEYISAPITILVELVSVVFKLMKPLMKVAQNLLKPLNNLIDTIQSWGNGALTDHQEIVVEGFDELVKSTKEIADNVKSLADAVDKVRSTIQSLNKATKSIQSTVSKLINTTYNKDMLRGIYEATIVSIEDQKLYKDDSVNLELYKSLFDEYGNVNEEIGNRILLNLNHSELDSNDFYAGTGEKLKDLVSQLMSLQSDQNSGYETLENAVSDVLDAENTLTEYERQLKEMLAAGGLDAKGTDAIKSTLKEINSVKEEISDFKKDFGGSDANKATIIGGLKEKIQAVSEASDDTVTELNDAYFGAKSSLGKLEASSNSSLTSIEGYVKSIRDYLLQNEKEALAAARKDELYNQYKSAVEAINYSGYFGYDGFEENQFLASMRKYIDSLSVDTLADSNMYDRLKQYASDFDIEGSRHSWYDGSSAYKNAQSYWTEAIGGMNSILKANISSAAGLLDYMRMTGTTTPVNDWDDGSDTTKQHTTAANLSREQQWNTMMQNRNKNRSEYSSEWSGLVSALAEPYYNPNGTYTKFFNTLSDDEWAAVVAAFNATKHDRAAVASLLSKMKSSHLKGLINDYTGSFQYNKFSKGGWTGGVSPDQITGFVHGQEYVVKAPYAADYRPALEAINAGRGESVFGSQSALQNVNINIDSTIRANDPLSMINEWNKELRNRNLRLELKKV